MPNVGAAFRSPGVRGLATCHSERPRTKGRTRPAGLSEESRLTEDAGGATPSRQQSSFVGVQAACSLRAEMMCSSVNSPFRIVQS